MKADKFSFTEENYLKSIYKLHALGSGKVTNITIAGLLKVNPATALEMIRRLDKKRLLDYDKKNGILLTSNGKKIAINTIRKHRLWEVFLAEKLEFSWDEIHEIAEQLEHVQSDVLTERLDKFLGFPDVDPHGDPIPRLPGKILKPDGQPLTSFKKNKHLILVGVSNHQDDFLKYLNKMGIGLGVRIQIHSIETFDKSYTVSVNEKKPITISEKAAAQLLVREK
jgi:DtxR family transcriptional regulator, Mn-dependent transcriptional regulator